MKKILNGKTGVTILEGIIALGLLALVAGGAFGVLLSASRQNTQPDIREEMVWAVEKAHDKLKGYNGQGILPTDTIPTNSQYGLCGTATSPDNFPLQEGPHEIKCLLPPICDPNQSSFTYEVEDINMGIPSTVHSETSSLSGKKITFSITCNGYKL